MGAHIHQTSTSGEPSESTGHTGGEMCSTVRLQPRECVPMKDLALHPSSSISRTYREDTAKVASVQTAFHI